MNKAAMMQAPAGQDWRATLPREWTIPHRTADGGSAEIPIGEHPALAKYASKDEAVKALVHAQRMLGRRPEGYMPVPGENSSPEEWDEIYAALGRPSGPEGYPMPELELPDDFEVRGEFQEEFLVMAHRLGLNVQQAQGLLSWFLPKVAGVHLDMQCGEQEERMREFDTLRSVHMGDTPSVLDQALQAAYAVGGEELLEALDSTGAGNRAAVISAFARMAPWCWRGVSAAAGATWSRP
ncbi:hypothetical protein [Salidesulfovibrio onnuriiensis]|uniref:hypothetical protein n=1 Tax=Salidesulfovibrio onnuriiensis TaxID=2583823 RepID=UPI00202B7CAE|nr:hypothetical protein [Salidesulfovibrio onnuriiensis]